MLNVEKNIKLLKKFTDDKKFNEAIQHISGEKWIFSENELNYIINKTITKQHSNLLFKNFLINNNILSKIYSYSYTNSSELRCEYISNINRDNLKNEQIISYLESRLKNLQLGFNSSKRKININGVISDYRNYYHNTTLYSFNSAHINKSVIIASIYDTLLCRQGKDYNLTNLFFDDETYGKYYIQTGSESMQLDEIQNNVKKINTAFRKKSNPSIKKKPVSEKKNIIQEVSWIETFDKMQNDITTYRIRQFILKKINDYLKIDSCIERALFIKYIRILAKAYSTNQNWINNKEDEIMISKIYKYLFHNNLDIIIETKTLVSDIIPNENMINQFLVKLFRIYTKSNFKFLYRLGNQYNKFYFLFAKSYMTVIGTPSENFVHSFSRIMSQALKVKLTNAA